jgi:hypothetical protein
MSSEEQEERRHFHRILYHGDAMLTGTDTTYPCNIIDICLKGCLLAFQQPWSGNLDEAYTLTLCLSDDVIINMQVKVTRVAEDRVGCLCEHIDIDSISNLRRLVELNLGNSDLLERELAALSGWGNVPK